MAQIIYSFEVRKKIFLSNSDLQLGTNVADIFCCYPWCPIQEKPEQETLPPAPGSSERDPRESNSPCVLIFLQAIN